MSHGDMATPNMINGLPLPPGITRDKLNRVWRAHCIQHGANPIAMESRVIPASRTDLVDYYVKKLLEDSEWMP